MLVGGRMRCPSSLFRLHASPSLFMPIRHFLLGPFPMAALLCWALVDQPALPRDSLPESIALDRVPRGLETRPVPADNPLTQARVQLGRRLFFDPLLSRN